MTTLHVVAPAKLNLGLEVVRKRPDGYHDIDTIMAMIDLCDEITVTATDTPGVSIAGMDHVPAEQNLMTRAVRAWSEASGSTAAVHIDIDKRIPSPAGLAGGSSDATAILRAVNAIYGEPMDMAQLHRIARTIGADCPFFLDGPAARATGIGDRLTPVPPPSGWAVVAVPVIEIAAKTTTLYKSLHLQDFGDGTRINEIQQHLEQGQLPGGSLFNSFSRAMMSLSSESRRTWHAFQSVGVAPSLTGAGPSVYTLANSEESAKTIAGSIHEILGNVPVFVARFLDQAPNPAWLP